MTSLVKFPKELTKGTLLIWIDMETSNPSVVRQPASNPPVIITFLPLKTQILFASLSMRFVWFDQVWIAKHTVVRRNIDIRLWQAQRWLGEDPTLAWRIPGRESCPILRLDSDRQHRRWGQGARHQEAFYNCGWAQLFHLRDKKAYQTATTCAVVGLVENNSGAQP